VEETNLDQVTTLEQSPDQPPTVGGITWSEGKKWARVVESSTIGMATSKNVAQSGRQEWLLSARVGILPQSIDMAHGWEIRFLPMESGQFEDELRDKWPDLQTKTNQPLQDWRFTGRTNFSGTAEYTFTFQLDEDHLGDRPVLLDLGDVRETARVSINSQPVGDLLWPPYEIRVESFLQPGQNSLAITVTNTMANRLEPPARPSGLLGPVRLVFGQMVQLDLTP